MGIGRDVRFNYWNLNYRKKFIRTFWMFSVVLFLLFQFFIMINHSNFILYLMALLIIPFLIQVS